MHLQVAQIKRMDGMVFTPRMNQDNSRIHPWDKGGTLTGDRRQGTSNHWL